MNEPETFWLVLKSYPRITGNMDLKVYSPLIQDIVKAHFELIARSKKISIVTELGENLDNVAKRIENNLEIQLSDYPEKSETTQYVISVEVKELGK